MNYQPDKIPIEMKLEPRWVLWKLEQRGGDKPTKVPYQVNGRKASSVDPKTWGSFEKVDHTFTNEKGYTGIGFNAGVQPEGWIFIDLDDCLFNGVLTSDAQNIIDLSNSYTEVSPSGKGLHIFLKGYLPGPPIKPPGGFGQIDDHARYFTITGNVFQNHTELRDLTVEGVKAV